MQRVLDICESRVSLDALRGARVEPFESDRRLVSLALCVDGTSATRKSTVLARTGLSVRKVQRFVPVRNADTYFPSMIGYIAAGINRQNTVDGVRATMHLNDRSYLNALEWCVLWRLMDDYVRRKGNTDPLDREAEDAEERREMLEGYRQAFRDLAASYHYRALRRKFRALAFVDSNVARCDETRARRNEGSDAERSAWRFYTPLQNLMYETLYPRAYVDLAWFDDEREDETLLVDSLAVWLRRLCERLADSQADATPTVPHCAFRLPVADAGRDYSLRNMEVHVYRTFGRLATRRIVERAIATTSASVSSSSDYAEEMEDEEEAEEERGRTKYENEEEEEETAERSLVALCSDLARSVPDHVCVDGIPEILYENALTIADNDRDHEYDCNDDDDDDDEAVIEEKEEEENEENGSPRKRLRLEGRGCREALAETRPLDRGASSSASATLSEDSGCDIESAAMATLEDCCIDSMFD